MPFGTKNATLCVCRGPDGGACGASFCDDLCVYVDGLARDGSVVLRFLLDIPHGIFAVHFDGVFSRTTECVNPILSVPSLSLLNTVFAVARCSKTEARARLQNFGVQYL